LTTRLGQLRRTSISLTRVQPTLRTTPAKWNTTKRAFSTKDTAKDAVASAKQAAQSATDTIKDAAASAAKTVKSTDVAGAAKTAVDSAKSAAASAAETLKSAASDLPSAKGAAASATAAATSAAETIKSAASHLPSSVKDAAASASSAASSATQTVQKATTSRTGLSNKLSRRAAQEEYETRVMEDPTKEMALHTLYMRVGLLLDYLGVEEGRAEEEFLSKYSISPGHSTLEWVFPSPPPNHLFEEAALVKNPFDDDEEVDQAHH